MRSAVPSAKTMARFISCYRSTAGLFQLFVAARSEPCAGRAREISRGIASGSSIGEIARNLQRAASTVSRQVARTEGAHDIEPVKPIIRPGSRLCGPGLACSPCASNRGRSSPVN